MIVRGVLGTVGILTPRHGWIKVTWSLRAVVKIELRIELLQ